MKITSIGLLSDDVEAVSFDLRNVQSHSPYMIRSIVGLDAEDLIPKFYGFNIDGDKKFYDFKMKPRLIVMRVVVNPRYKLGETVSDVRDRLYKTISSSRSGEVTLEFRGGGSTIAKINGYIIKFEVSYFSDVPELQITVKCNDPIFRGVAPVLMESTDFVDGSETVLVPDGLSTAPHGMEFQVLLTNAQASFTIQDKASDPEWEFKVIPDGGFAIGDSLNFSSEFGNKYLYIVRSGVTTHVFDKVTPTSVWPTLFPGTNSFHFVDADFFDWVFLRFSPAYWGV